MRCSSPTTATIGAASVAAAAQEKPTSLRASGVSSPSLLRRHRQGATFRYQQSHTIKPIEPNSAIASRRSLPLVVCKLSTQRNTPPSAPSLQGPPLPGKRFKGASLQFTKDADVGLHEQKKHQLHHQRKQQQGHEETVPDVHYSAVQKLVLLASCLQGFSVFGVGSILTTLYMTDTLGFGSVEVGVMIGTGSAGALGGTLFAGLASRWGLTNGQLYSSFTSLCFLGSLFFVFADPLLPQDLRSLNLDLHYLGNVLISAGVSGLFTLTGPLLTSANEREEHANAARLSTLNTLMPAGALLGSLVGGRVPSFLLNYFTSHHPEASTNIVDYYQPTLLCYPASYLIMLLFSLAVFGDEERKQRREKKLSTVVEASNSAKKTSEAVATLPAISNPQDKDGDHAPLALIFSATFFVAVANATTFLGSFYLSENYAASAATIGTIYFIKESLAIPAGYSGQYFIDSFGTKAVLVGSSLGLAVVAGATGIVDHFETYALLLIMNVCISKLFSTSSTNYALSRVAPEQRTMCAAVQGAGLCLSGVALGASGFIMKVVGSTGFFLGTGAIGAVGGWLWLVL